MAALQCWWPCECVPSLKRRLQWTQIKLFVFWIIKWSYCLIPLETRGRSEVAADRLNFPSTSYTTVYLPLYLECNHQINIRLIAVSTSRWHSGRIQLHHPRIRGHRMRQNLHVSVQTSRMIGETGKEGISALTMIDLLGRANEMRKYRNVIIRISYIEIYNEIIKDLLVS